jgi:hypothetical protein
MQALTKSDEQKLFDGVKKASYFVDKENMSPNDALHKVALELQYSPGFLKKACHAFNTGRQLAQWEANQNVLDKLASFPLADYDAIHDKIWGNTQEKAASVNYGYVPVNGYESLIKQDLLASSGLEKAAEAKPELLTDRTFDHYQYHKLLESEARTEKTAAELKFNSAITDLIHYFQKSAYDRLSFAQVDYAVGVEYGNQGKALMNVLAENFPKEKRAAAHSAKSEIFKQAADFNTKPYTMVKSAIDAAGKLNSTISKLEQAQQKTAELRTRIDAMYESLKPVYTVPAPLTFNLLDKEANIAETSAVLGFGGPSLARRFGLGATTEESEVQKQLKKLEDPNHNNELRKIRAQTALNSLMTDPDNPLSEYDPEDVLSAYNELVQVAPRIADQPAMLNPLLNKRMAGRIEPFEIAETLRMENALQTAQKKPHTLVGHMFNPMATLQNDNTFNSDIKKD